MKQEIKALEKLVNTFDWLANEGVVMSDEEQNKANELVKRLRTCMDSFLMNNPATFNEFQLKMYVKSLTIDEIL